MTDEINKELEALSDELAPDGQSKTDVQFLHRLRSQLREFSFGVKVPLDFHRFIKGRHFSFVHERKATAASRLRFYAFVLFLLSLTYLVAVPLTHDYLVEAWKLLPVWLAAALVTALAGFQIKAFDRRRFRFA